MSATSIFLHSTGTTPAMWANVPEAVFAGTSKLTPLHIGYSSKAPLARGTTVSGADEAAKIMTGLPAEGDVHLYGHSYGGVVALHLFAALGARVKSLFLYEPVMFGALMNDGADLPEEAHAEMHRLREGAPWFLDDAERGGGDAWMEVFIDYWNRPGTWRRLPDEQRAWTLGVGWKMYQEVRACFLEVTRFDAFPLSTVPTTIAMGERSPKASRAMAQGLVRANPGVRLVELAGAGHMAPITHAAKVGELMVEHAVRLRG